MPNFFYLHHKYRVIPFLNPHMLCQHKFLYKYFLHTSQLQGVSPLWISMCTVNFNFGVYIFTQITVIRAFPSVNLHVFYQYNYLCKTLSTHITIIGSSPIVVPCVLCQYKFICKKYHAPQWYGYSLVWSLTCLPSQITYFCVTFLILATMIKTCPCMRHHFPCPTI